MNKAEADAWLRENPGARDGLKRLPDDVDAALAAAHVLSMIPDDSASAWGLGRSCQRLPATVIREVVRLLPNEATSVVRLFLREYVTPSLADAALKDAWVEAMHALLDLNVTYAWGSRQRKAKLQSLAKRPRVVSAVQAAVVGSANASLDMLAVLAIDSSEASIDALLPLFSDGKQQARLEALATHAAKTPAMKALLAGATRNREAKERTSSAVEVIGRLVGDPSLERVKFSVSFGSTELQRGDVPLIQAYLSVNSAKDVWWSMSVTRVDRAWKMPTNSFGAEGAKQDDLDLGSCAFEELPTWVEQAAKKLQVEFRVAFLSGSLRGKKREAFTAWLLPGR